MSTEQTNNIAAATTMRIGAFNVHVNHADKPEKFNGLNFKRWQQKMLFYLTTLNLVRFLGEDAPTLGQNVDAQAVTALDAWKHFNFLCRNYVINCLMDTQYNVYSSIKNADKLLIFIEFMRV
ncbi:hypothetical protein C2S51_038535 [Perilla frutescens var. frutescens]|nr:hypothetical protein C2S51_038535 [Perilla frutescens var. frutescens]